MESGAAPEQRTLRVLRTALLVAAILLVAAVVIWIVDGRGEAAAGKKKRWKRRSAPRVVSRVELGEAAARSKGSI